MERLQEGMRFVSHFTENQAFSISVFGTLDGSIKRRITLLLQPPVVFFRNISSTRLSMKKD